MVFYSSPLAGCQRQMDCSAIMHTYALYERIENSSMEYDSKLFSTIERYKDSNNNYRYTVVVFIHYSSFAYQFSSQKLQSYWDFIL